MSLNFTVKCIRKFLICCGLQNPKIPIGLENRASVLREKRHIMNDDYYSFKYFGAAKIELACIMYHIKGFFIDFQKITFPISLIV